MKLKIANLTCRRCKRHRFNPWVRKIPWRREWQPTPVCLPRNFHAERSLAGCSPWGRKESDTTEWLSVTHSPDPWSTTLLSHHQPMRRKSHTLQPSLQKPLGISGGFEHKLLVLLAWPCDKPFSAPYDNILVVGFILH